MLFTNELEDSMRIVMTGFAAGRHFDNPEFGGTKIPTTIDSFLDKVNTLAETADLADGYAPFCKHLFAENFTGALSGVVEITSRNDMRLHTGYVARREGELPILTRWFDSLDVDLEPAPYLDVILYSAEQLKQEGIEIDGEWGIVSINSVSSAAEDPMPPITMMRNALGKEQGGSGVPLDAEEYQRAVEFWSNHATVR
jgi:hypothetical protein|tara:strand:- start:18382 stop:18975 length:594 start_codon:yes stop_codon:yes gene_type:complete